MKDVNFDGNLKKDIEISNKNWNWTRNLLKALGVVLIIGAIAIPTMVPTIGIYIIGSIVILGSTMILCNSKKQFEKEKTSAKLRLLDLTEELKNNNVIVDTKHLENALINEKVTKTITTTDDKKTKNKEIEQDIYFLDSQDKLQALREKHSIIINGVNKLVNNSIELYEEEDLREVKDQFSKRLILK